MWSNSLPSVLQSQSATAYISGGKKIQYILGMTAVLAIATFVVARPAPALPNISSQPPATTLPASPVESLAPLDEPSVTTDVQISTNSQTSTSGTTDVSINNEQITLPPNSSYQTSIQGDGSSQVNINVSSDNSGSTYSHSNTNIQLHSFSQNTQSGVVFNSE